MMQRKRLGDSLWNSVLSYHVGSTQTDSCNKYFYPLSHLVKVCLCFFFFFFGTVESRDLLTLTNLSQVILSNTSHVRQFRARMFQNHGQLPSLGKALVSEVITAGIGETVHDFACL